MQRHFSLLRGTALVAAFLGTGGPLGAAELPKSPEVAETGKLAIANTLAMAEDKDFYPHEWHAVGERDTYKCPKCGRKESGIAATAHGCEETPENVRYAAHVAAALRSAAAVTV